MAIGRVRRRDDALLDDGAVYVEAEGGLFGVGEGRGRGGSTCWVGGGGCGDEGLEDFVLKMRREKNVRWFRVRNGRLVETYDYVRAPVADFVVVVAGDAL